MASSLEKIKKLQEELNSIVVERQNEIEGALAALISGTHVLLLGPPGTAKSLLANSICSSIEGGTFFQWLLTKFSTPEELFGPYSLKGLENDEYRRKTEGKLPEASIGFLDEVFKANSAILNALLTVINERKFHNNGHPVDVPLLTCFGASNELPQGEELGALYDRFILRYWVKPLQSDKSFFSLLSGGIGEGSPTTKVSLTDLKELKEQARAITVSDECYASIRQICLELRDKGIVASDRRWKTAVGVLKAVALLRGNTEVTADDLETLVDMLWNTPEDKRTVFSVVSPYANPFNVRAVEFLDSVEEVYSRWKTVKKDTTASIQAYKQLKEILAKLEDEAKDRPPVKVKKLLDVAGKTRMYLKEIQAAAFA